MYLPHAIKSTLIPPLQLRQQIATFTTIGIREIYSAPVPIWVEYYMLFWEPRKTADTGLFATS